MDANIGLVNISVNVNLNLGAIPAESFGRFTHHQVESREPDAIYDRGKYGERLASHNVGLVWAAARHRLYRPTTLPDAWLPYSLEALFFKDGEHDDLYLPFDDLKLSYDVSYDAVSDVLTDQSGWFPDDYKRRVLASCDETQTRHPTSENRRQLRVVGIDRATRTVRVARTSYNRSFYTNFCMDMPRSPAAKQDTLRRATTPESGGPPPLDDLRKEVPRLGNGLGIAILIHARGDGFLVPLRNGRHVTIFRDEWGCSSSFASPWLSGVEDGSVATLKRYCELVITDHVQKELALSPSAFPDGIRPLALMREWFRGGMPQLFFAAESNLPLGALRETMETAEHRKEVLASAAEPWWRRWFWRRGRRQEGRRTVYEGDALGRRFSIEYMMCDVLAGRARGVG